VQTAEALQVSMATVWNVRKRFADAGLEAAINEGSRPGRTPKLNPKQKACLIAVAGSRPPAGYPFWSLRLLAEKMVELGFADSICHETIRAVLKEARCEIPEAAPLQSRGTFPALIEARR